MQPVHGLGAGWDAHVLLAYHSEQERSAGVAAWVRSGLRAEAKIIYVDAAGESDTGRFLELLAAGGLDATYALVRGQVQLVDGTTCGLGSRWPTAVVTEGLRAGYRSVHVAREVGACDGPVSARAYEESERTADAMCDTGPVSVLCQYPADTDPAVLATACALHSAGTRGKRLQTVPVPGGLALVGEVDAGNHKILRAALAAACRGAEAGGSPVLLDLQELRFLDTAGARAMVMATAAYREGGGLVRLHSAQSCVDRLLRLLGVNRAEGILVEDAA